MNEKAEMIRDRMSEMGCEYLELELEDGDIVYTDGEIFTGGADIDDVEIDEYGDIIEVKGEKVIGNGCVDEKTVLESSVYKWEDIVERLRDGQKPDIFGYCGFCVVFGEIDDDGIMRCNKCPLFLGGYCNAHMDDDILFWEIDKEIMRGNIDEALRYSEIMLERIKYEVERR